MLLKARRTSITQDNGGFVVHLNMPGWMRPWPTDHGHGPLALIAESFLVPGRLIEMHHHQNDEIISWVPDGVMRHEDKINGGLVTDRDHLMVMNAGRSFWHSERTLPSDPPLRMLQIFVRPRALDLEPAIQHGPIAAVAVGTWRHLFGPEGTDAPFHVRNRVDFHDIRLTRGMSADFPSGAGRDLYFYVFSGAISAGGRHFAEAEQGLLVGGGNLTLTAQSDAVVVAFLIDPRAAVTRRGTIGDHRRIPPPLLGKAVNGLLRLRSRRAAGAQAATR